MRKYGLPIVLSTAVVVLGASAAFADGGDRVGNGSPMSVAPDLPIKCTFHHTKACDGALAAWEKENAVAHPMGEGLPLPWPFPWWLHPHAAKS